MLKFGRITDVNPSTGLARVHLEGEDIVSNWLPISVMRSRTDKISFPVSINEQVWCIMDERCEYGVIGGAIYSTKNLPPAGTADKMIIALANGSQITFGLDNGTLDIICTGDIKLKAQHISIEANGDIELKSNTKFQITSPLVKANETLNAGNIEATEDVKVGVVSLKQHKHISSTSGNATSTPI